MEVWIVQWDYVGDGETTVSVWTSESAALQSVCESISDKIDDWDMDDPDMLQCAEAIEVLMDGKKYREVMDKWNDFQSDYDPDRAEYWNVYHQPLLSGDNEEGVVTSAPSVKYRASSPGATCRGQCRNYSHDTYADKPDGTYFCRQCQIFQGIFGS